MTVLRYWLLATAAVAGLITLVLCVIGGAPGHLDAAPHLAMPYGPPNAVTSLDYHGGPTLTTSRTYAIFWIPPGSVFEQGAADTQAYETLIIRYLRDVGDSPLYNVVTQYYMKRQAGQQSIRNSSSFGGAYADAHPYPESGTTGDPVRDRDVRREILRVIQQTGWTATRGNVFLVYTADHIQSCIGTGRRHCSFNEYCAYHSSFIAPTFGSIVYANLPDASLDSQNCLARDDNGRVLSPNSNPIADGEVSITSHEQFEMITDPLVGKHAAWADSSGNEIADKCVGSYGSLTASGSNVSLHGNPYIVQQEFSNADGGCVSTHGHP